MIGVSLIAVIDLPVTALTVGVSLRFLNLKIKRKLCREKLMAIV